METVSNSLPTSGADALGEAKQRVEKTLIIDEYERNDPNISLASRVSNVLQTTLQLNELLDLYSKQIKPAIPHDGIRYQNDGIQLSFEVGSIGSYVCQFDLVVNNEKLGQVSIGRHREFSAEETKVMEYTLSSLLFPLRNALMYREALQRAHKDPLTGVYNRATLEETLARETKVAQRYVRPLALLVLDIDHFKRVNDTFGHTVGDCVIKATAERTASCIRSTDILFRFGGEEFVVLLSNTDLPGAQLLAERIRRGIEANPVRCGNVETSVTVSLGVSELNANDTSSSFFVRSDEALYRAKQQGRNRVEIG